MNNRLNSQMMVLLWVLSCTILYVAVLVLSPIMPLDETRYASVTWEMWLQHHWLIPIKNAMAYPDKPPLLFWLNLMGWHFFGVSTYWLRIVPTFFSLGCIGVTWQLARQLWPEQKDIALMAPFVLIGSIYFTYYTAHIRFDILLTFFTITAVSGFLAAMQSKWYGWLIVILALGFGLLSKGPLILLYVLLPMLILPLLRQVSTIKKTTGYAMSALATILGCVIALLWAIPAAIKAGPHYTDAIFWHQTINRVVADVAYRPWYYYVIRLPLIFLPWTIWLPVWQGLFKVFSRPLGRGLIINLILIVPSFLIMSLLVGQKAVRYILPLFPFVALLIARALNEVEFDMNILSRYFAPILTLLIGIIYMAVTFFPAQQSYPAWLARLNPIWGLILIGLACFWLFWRETRVSMRVIGLAISTVIVVVFFYLTWVNAQYKYFDLTPMALRMALIQQSGHVVADTLIAEHNDQYKYLGRLRQPVPIVKAKNADEWARQHPNDYIITYVKAKQLAQLNLTVKPLFWQHFRSDHLAMLWRGRYLVNGGRIP